MSFDLELLHQEEHPFDLAAFCDTLAQKEDYTLSTETGTKGTPVTEIVYEHESTGVHFRLSHHVLDKDEADDEDAHPGYRSTGVWLNVNYNRPTFFIYEVVQELGVMMGTLDLYMMDPQGKAKPEPWDNATLVASWIKSNESASRYLIGEMSADDRPFFIPRDTMLETWKVRYLKSRMQDPGLDLEFFVPEVYFVVDNLEQRTARSSFLFQPRLNIMVPLTDQAVVFDSDVDPPTILGPLTHTQLAPMIGTEPKTVFEYDTQWDITFLPHYEDSGQTFMDKALQSHKGKFTKEQRVGFSFVTDVKLDATAAKAASPEASPPAAKPSFWDRLRGKK